MRALFSIFQEKPIPSLDMGIQKSISEACKNVPRFPPVDRMKLKEESEWEKEPKCVTIKHTKNVDLDKNDYVDGAYKEGNDWVEHMKYNCEIAKQVNKDVMFMVTIEENWSGPMVGIITTHITLCPKN